MKKEILASCFLTFMQCGGDKKLFKKTLSFTGLKDGELEVLYASCVSFLFILKKKLDD